jgi:two-component system phosphate regulon response regulator PhoB
MSATNTLIIDSDPHSVDLLSWLLGREGFEVRTAQTGSEGIQLAETSLPDLIVVDWMFSDLPGLEVCRRLRAKGDTHDVPIVMVADGADEVDRARALDSGIDDFVSKPFGAREIVARVYALLRRTRKDCATRRLSFAGLEMDVGNYKVKRDDTSVSLSPLQFRLLRHFLEHPGQVFSREQLLDSVWGAGADVDARSVDAQIRRLRSAINKGHRKDLFRTVRMGGYSLDGGN